MDPLAGPLMGRDLAGAAAVAVVATISWIATVSLGIWILTLFILSKTDNSRREWAKSRIAFMGTPFGTMYVNLIVADALQATGWGLNFIWVNHQSYDTYAPSCVVQAFLIQFGDVASALSNLLIAVHTFCVLTPKWRPPNWPFATILGGLWTFNFLLAIIGPSARNAWTGDHPYYGWTGEWCWVREEYNLERLFLHYLWFFIAMFGSSLLYIILFWRLRKHFRMSHKNSDATPSGLSHRSNSRGANQLRARALNRAGRYMLLYPLAFILITLPLAAYRLAAMAGQDWGKGAAAATGSIFVLAGTVDVILFGFTRNIISVPARRHRITITEDGSRFHHGPEGAAGPSLNLRVEVQQDTIVFDDEEQADSIKADGKYLAEPVRPPKSTRSPFWERKTDDASKRLTRQRSFTPSLGMDDSPTSSISEKRSPTVVAFEPPQSPARVIVSDPLSQANGGGGQTVWGVQSEGPQEAVEDHAMWYLGAEKGDK